MVGYDPVMAAFLAQRWIRPALVAMLSFTAFPAYAQNGAAELLFQEGRRLMKEKNFKEACPKLEKSAELDPSSGTLLNLGGCREETGEIASAWVAYSEARRIAQAQGKPERDAQAKERADRIAHRVPKYVLRVTQPNASLQLDGKPIDAKQYGVEVPVDPGKRLFEASTPKGRTWSNEIAIVEGQTFDVAVPLFAPDDIEAPQAPGTSKGTWVKPVGFTVLGLGVAGVGFGVVAGLLASGKLSDAQALCPGLAEAGEGPVQCSADAVALNDSARSWANIATISLIAGGALAATGFTMVLLAPKRQQTAFLPTRLSFTPAGFRLSGSF